MWAKPAPSTQQHEIRSCVNVCVKVHYDCGEFKECNEEENVCVCIVCSSILSLFSRDVYLCDISVCVGQRSAERPGQAKPKKSQAKLSMGSCSASYPTRQVKYLLATKVRMEQSVN